MTMNQLFLRLPLHRKKGSVGPMNGQTANPVVLKPATGR